MSLARLLCTACSSRALTELTKYYGRQMSGRISSTGKQV